MFYRLRFAPGEELHPCIKYTQLRAAPPSGVAVITPGSPGSCGGVAKATLRRIRIVAP
jgi:hypothetical protein